MRNTLKIREVINRYKAYKRYKEMIKQSQPESIEHYKFYEMDALRELVILKAENPKSFMFACALDKLILN